MDFALVFPGQGSQKPGMGRDLFDAHPAAAGIFRAADDALGVSLSSLCFDGPADTLMETHNAQPALLTHGIAMWRLLSDRFGAHVRCTAGHSLGEFTAHVAAGTFDFETAVRLVRTRGELMQAAGTARPGAMAAILGDIDVRVRELCEQASREAGVVVPANFNSPGQVVVSGEVAGVDRLIELAKEHGARKCIKLQVSGAFHSPLMEAARPEFTAALDAATMRDATLPVYANVTGRQVMQARQSRRLLGEQMTSPVRWTETIRNIAEDFPGIVFIELGPGNVLGGLIRKIVPDATVHPAGTVANLDAILELPVA
ncbi:MAG TPA: ACP S-malonyltransferase [Gemmatimonadaceae bacterium]|nr:ACP S-malonyltransferase [Gemmatimonadaceae bacterium]